MDAILSLVLLLGMLLVPICAYGLACLCDWLDER